MFARSEASLDEAAGKDVGRNGGEKKKFVFYRLRKKLKSGSAPEKSANESRQVLRYVRRMRSC